MVCQATSHALRLFSRQPNCWLPSKCDRHRHWSLGWPSNGRPALKRDGRHLQPWRRWSRRRGRHGRVHGRARVGVGVCVGSLGPLHQGRARGSRPWLLSLLVIEVRLDPCRARRLREGRRRGRGGGGERGPGRGRVGGQKSPSGGDVVVLVPWRRTQPLVVLSYESFHRKHVAVAVAIHRKTGVDCQGSLMRVVAHGKFSLGEHVCCHFAYVCECECE